MLLALETATDRASVAVGPSEAEAVETSVSGARRHASSLLPMVKTVLAKAGHTLDDLTAVVVSDGPGSFTGLRVGAAVAKALVQARGLRLWTAPSLLVRAAGAGIHDATILAVSDALRGDIYAAAYRFATDRIVTELAPTVCRPEDLEARVGRPRLIVGDVPASARQSLEQWSRSGSGPFADWRAGCDTTLGTRRPHGRCARDRRPGRMGTGVRETRRSAGTLGDGAWTLLTEFGRQSQLTRRPCSRSSGGASPTPGARRASRRR